MDNSLKHFFGSLRDHIGNIVNLNEHIDISAAT